MQRPKRPLRARVERDDEVHVQEDENAHLWAVSYSDFLMALLSFFILFSSFDSSTQKERFIKNLAEEFGGQPAKHALADGSGSESSGDSSLRSPASLFKDFSNVDVKVESENENLIINFPSDLYAPGRHLFKNEKLPLIKAVLDKLKPYQDNIQIYFEGHADSAPLRVHRNNIVTNNFVLSSLRANSALSAARDMGFSEKNMFIQAASSNLRNTRSLSLRIQPIPGARP